MGIEQAFGFGREAEIIYVNKGADYSSYEIRIAELEGAVRGYKKGIAELTDVARRNKDLAERNMILANLWVDTLRELVAKGRTTREEANAIKVKLEKRLPEEEAQLLARLGS